MKTNTKRSHEITFAGFTFGGVTAFVLVAAVNSQTNLLFFAFGLMLGAMIVSSVIGAIMLRHVDVERLTADHAIVNQPSEVHYRITNKKRRWPCFAVHVTEARFHGELLQTPNAYCLHIAPKSSALIITQLIPAHRGIIELTELRYSCAFPFGFLRRAVHLVNPFQITVYPRIGNLNRELALRCREAATIAAQTSDIRGGNDEFYGLREYRPGDNIRTIHWRRSARTRTLMVREMTTDSPPQLIIALNLRTWRIHPDGAAQVEHAIELAAALLCHAFHQDFAVGLFIPGLPNAAPNHAQDQSPAQPHGGREHRAHLLHTLATLSPQSIPNTPISPPLIRGKIKPQWILVTLTQTDPLADLTPPNASLTILPLDHPASPTWLTFPTLALGGN